jgi:hypothetical protein
MAAVELDAMWMNKDDERTHMAVQMRIEQKGVLTALRYEALHPTAWRYAAPCSH